MGTSIRVSSLDLWSTAAGPWGHPRKEVRFVKLKGLLSLHLWGKLRWDDDAVAPLHSKGHHLAPNFSAQLQPSVATKKRDGREFDEISDAVDDVNVQMLKLWDEESEFDAEKDKARFRQYDDACDRVKNFYKEQHEKQTVAFNIQARVNFKSRRRARMGIWEAMEMLNTLVDESDPDTSLSQIEHLLQTAEAIRRDGKPDWMQVTGLVHDLGKLLFLFESEGQWDVVGDTFVVGCKFSDKIIYPETFEANLDSHDRIYSTENGIYQPHCGLDNVMLSWGHDEYLYHVLKGQSSLPEEALAMIRYHSFYPWHREGAYSHLTNEKDKRALAAVRAFNPYDLYSKSDDPVDAEALRPYYERLIAKFFPPVLDW